MTTQPKKPGTRRPNPEGAQGRILTVKNLSRDAYNLIHRLPKGKRQETMRALLEGAVDFAHKEGIGWHDIVIAGSFRIRKS